MRQQLSNFMPRDERFREKVRESFSQQRVMETIGASLISIDPGRVEIGFMHNVSLTQHHGFIHAGIVTTVLDSACGYAAFSLMPGGTSVLTVEFKSNFLAPAQGDSYLAVGSVKKPHCQPTGSYSQQGKQDNKCQIVCDSSR